MTPSTNTDKPFERDEIIELFDEMYIVLANYGEWGRVMVLGCDEILYKFWWDAGSHQAKRVELKEP